MNKKIITITLALAMAFNLAACKGNSASGSNNKPAENAVNDTKNGGAASDNSTKPETGDETTQEESEPSTEGTDYFTGLQKGTYISFGTYEYSSGNEKPIEWEVLDVDGDKALLVSRYIIDCLPYNEERAGVSWETCSLRKWLNDEFYNKAFSPEEQRKIKTVTLENEGNEVTKTEAGNDTNDRVFCLSVSELKKYYKFNKWSDTGYCYCDALVIPATDYAKRGRLRGGEIDEGHYRDYLSSNGYTKDIIGAEGAGWWLRTSAGETGDHACNVSFDGRTGKYTFNYVDANTIGVRPAIFVSVK